ncbi:hypothetical protein NKH77_53250 [Streptomyces sp. M19]
MPRRVAALLSPRPRARGGCSRVLCSALLACVALSGAAAVDAARDLHSTIEVAQGESAGS